MPTKEYSAELSGPGRGSRIYFLFLLVGILLLPAAAVVAAGVIMFGAASAAKTAIPCRYDEASSFSEGLAAVRKDGRWGCINKSGKMVIAPRFEYVTMFSDGLAGVILKERCGFIDTTGALVIPLQYEVVFQFSEGLAVVKKDGRWGCLDRTGKIVIPCRFERMTGFSGGMALVREGTKVGVMDGSGKVSFHPEGEMLASLCRENRRAVHRNGKWGYLDKDGREAIPCRFDFVQAFSDGLATVREGQFWGAIDPTGKWVIPARYNYLPSFSEKVTPVRGVKYFGYIGLHGETVIPEQFAAAGSFSGGYAVVGMERQLGLIERVVKRMGNWLRTGGLRKPWRDLVAAETEMRYGLIDHSGKIVVPAVFAAMVAPHDGMALVRKAGKWCYIAVPPPALPIIKEREKN